jgi:hypothetical protein
MRAAELLDAFTRVRVAAEDYMDEREEADLGRMLRHVGAGQAPSL